MLLEFRASKRKGKKYDAIIHEPNKPAIIVSFGEKGMAQYKDRTGLGLYSNLDHLDNDRRKKYQARHSKILTASGTPAYLVQYSPAWFSWHYLW